MHYARSSRKAGNRALAGKGKSARPYHQRCAVRVTYSKNKIRGQWKAHGRYLARESASLEQDAKYVGFNRDTHGVDIAAQLACWQTAGDRQMWKLIVSPEFGDRVDLVRLTRDLVTQMEKDLGTALEWVAAKHHNTEHPHVHVAIRGIRYGGEVLRMSRDYVQQGIRSVAADLCTRQLGYRTEIDSLESERREVSEKRLTSIDRRLLKATRGGEFELWQGRAVAGRNPDREHELARLAVLRRMGLAEPTGPNSWRLHQDLEQILRAMPRTRDRQRMLAAHGALISDQRLRIEVLDLTQPARLEGRVLVHGEDEQTGRNYLMLEGTDAKVHFIQYTPEIEAARGRGEMKTNSFVRLRKLSGASILDISDLGDAEQLLRNSRHLSEEARDLLKRGFIPAEDGWGGWLGRYQTAIRRAFPEVDERNRYDQLPIPKWRDRLPERGR
jgi:type IV secretory pathway VirD2 relaxase